MDWKAAREQAGLTLAQMATQSGYGISAINKLELKNEGSERLRKSVLEVLAAVKNTRCVIYPTEDSAKSGVARLIDQPDLVTPEQWKLRAIQAEEKLEQLQANVRAALRISEAPPARVSSKPASAAATFGARGAASTKTDPAE